METMQDARVDSPTLDSLDMETAPTDFPLPPARIAARFSAAAGETATTTMSTKRQEKSRARPDSWPSKRVPKSELRVIQSSNAGPMLQQDTLEEDVHLCEAVVGKRGSMIQLAPRLSAITFGGRSPVFNSTDDAARPRSRSASSDEESHPFSSSSLCDDQDRSVSTRSSSVDDDRDDVRDDLKSLQVVSLSVVKRMESEMTEDKTMIRELERALGTASETVAYYRKTYAELYARHRSLLASTRSSGEARPSAPSNDGSEATTTTVCQAPRVALQTVSRPMHVLEIHPPKQLDPTMDALPMEHRTTTTTSRPATFSTSRPTPTATPSTTSVQQTRLRAERAQARLEKEMELIRSRSARSKFVCF